MKIYITTIAFDNEDFILFQKKSIDKYILDKDVDFIVFDDSKTVNNTLKIKNKCLELNIKYIRVDQKIHLDRNLVFVNPLTNTRKIMMKYDNTVNGHNFPHDIYGAGYCHCSSVQFIFNYFRNNIEYSKGILFNLDSDMFFIDKLSVYDYIKDFDICRVNQGNGLVEYMWPNIFIFNMDKCKNLHEICWDGCKNL